jgi:hypothetical protein
MSCQLWTKYRYLTPDSRSKYRYLTPFITVIHLPLGWQNTVISLPLFYKIPLTHSRKWRRRPRDSSIFATW